MRRWILQLTESESGSIMFNKHPEGFFKLYNKDLYLSQIMQYSGSGSLVCVRILILLCIPSSRLVICCNLSLNLAFKSFVLAHSAQTWITSSLPHALMAFIPEEGADHMCHCLPRSWVAALLDNLSKSENVFRWACPKSFRCKSGTQKKELWMTGERWFAQIICSSKFHTKQSVLCNPLGFLQHKIRLGGVVVLPV